MKIMPYIEGVMLLCNNPLKPIITSRESNELTQVSSYRHSVITLPSPIKTQRTLEDQAASQRSEVYKI